MLSGCDKDVYIYQQEGVSADDLRRGAMPKLQHQIQQLETDRVIQIPEVMVMGQLSAGSVESRINGICKSKGKCKSAPYSGSMPAESLE